MITSCDWCYWSILYFVYCRWYLPMECFLPSLFSLGFCWVALPSLFALAVKFGSFGLYGTWKPLERQEEQICDLFMMKFLSLTAIQLKSIFSKDNFYSWSLSYYVLNIKLHAKWWHLILYFKMQNLGPLQTVIFLDFCF